MNNTLWNLENVTLSSGSGMRLDSVTLEIVSGVTAILGYSGAGKSSLVSLLAGMERPSSGELRFQVNAVQEKQGCLPLYWAPQGGGLWPHLTVRQHLETVMAPKAAESAKETDKLLDLFGLTHRSHAVPEELSQGEQSRLSLARCLAARPAVLLLDEPLAHVDPMMTPVYWNHLREHIRQTKASVVFTSHTPDIVMAEGEQVICLKNGRILYAGSTTDLYNRPPNEEVARFAGPTNWFTEDELHLWLSSLPDNHHGSLNIRPECIQLQPTENGPASILSHRHHGSHAITVLKHRESGTTREIIHRPAYGQHSVDQTVSIIRHETHHE